MTASCFHWENGYYKSSVVLFSQGKMTGKAYADVVSTGKWLDKVLFSLGKWLVKEFCKAFFTGKIVMKRPVFIGKTAIVKQGIASFYRENNHINIVFIGEKRYREREFQ